MEEMLTLFALLLYTTSLLVMDPSEGNTVSKKTVSVEKASCMDGLVSTLSFFRQDRKPNVTITRRRQQDNSFEIRMISVL
jgi:hypothetical protein